VQLFNGERQRLKATNEPAGIPLRTRISTGKITRREQLKGDIRTGLSSRKPGCALKGRKKDRIGSYQPGEKKNSHDPTNPNDSRRPGRSIHQYEAFNLIHQKEDLELL
jgi:hypothetical protein